MIPDDRKYSPEHEWIQVEGDVGTIGVTDHAAGERQAGVGIEPHDGVRETRLQGVRIGLADHVAGNIDRPVTAVTTGEGSARCHQADNAQYATGVADVFYLEGEVTGAAVHQHHQRRDRRPGVYRF